MENTKQLSAWSLCLPACRISESVQQLMELTLNTLCEAVGSSSQWYVTEVKELIVHCPDPHVSLTCQCSVMCSVGQQRPSDLDWNEITGFMIIESNKSV